MSRVEFKNIKQAKLWIEDVAISGGKDYHAYYTSNKELIFVPGKSTRPVIYGYIEHATEEEMHDVQKKISIYPCEEFEWNAERGLYREQI